MSASEEESENGGMDAIPVSNWDALAANLPEKGIARALLKAWIDGESAGRSRRLLAIAQPIQATASADRDTSQD